VVAEGDLAIARVVVKHIAIGDQDPAAFAAAHFVRVLDWGCTGVGCQVCRCYLVVQVELVYHVLQPVQTVLGVLLFSARIMSTKKEEKKERKKMRK
jgi:hypothetical protein